ncbi:MAG TPA: phospho-sugar mutase [Acidimicrobiales bacterium]
MNDVVALASAWIAVDPDEEDRATIQHLVAEGDDAELHRRFDTPLTFGTAGLRGPVMAGPAGMNRCTVRRATQGVIAWLRELDIDGDRGVVVGRDARHGSDLFNDEVVAVLLGAGVRVYEMPRPLPTPLCAYAVRSLAAGAGIMITASHNPPADNGYKLYGADGSQIIAPHDAIVERYALAAGPALLGDRTSPLHHVVDEELFETYRQHMTTRFGVDSSTVRLAYTPLYGVGGEFMTDLFARAGFGHVAVVDEQFAPDPDFPGLPFPNPEEAGVLDAGVATAQRSGAMLLLANDPDADRLGVAAVRDDGTWRVMRGDEIGWLLGAQALDEATTDDVVATTIVSSSMLEKMAASAGISCVTTLTGFKWITKAAPGRRLAFGYEEALGYAVDPLVADKDGLSAALALAHLAHDLARRGVSLLERLDELEAKFGAHVGAQLSLRVTAPRGRAALSAVMDRVRATPPATLGGVTVSEVIDLEGGWNGCAPTEGLIWRLGATGRVVVRPSGTEPKLKAYVEVVGAASPVDLIEERRSAATALDAILDDLATVLALDAD